MAHLLVWLTAVVAFQCPDVDALLLKWGDDDPAVRDRASAEAIALWETWSESDLTRLETAAKDPKGEPGIRAHRALQRIKLRRLIGSPLMKDSPDVEESLAAGGEPVLKALDLLCQAQGKGQVTSDALESTVDVVVANRWTQGVPLEAIDRLVVHRGRRLCAALLLPHLADRDPFVRERAAWSLGLSGARKFARELLPLLRDYKEHPRTGAVAPNPWNAALWSIARLGASDHAAAVLQGLKDAPEEVRFTATQVLVRWGARAQEDSLVRWMENPPASLKSNARDYARANAAMALSSTGRKEHSERIVQLLADPSPTVRYNAATALARFGFPEQAAAVRPLLKDKDTMVQLCAMNALVTLRAERFEEELMKHLLDPNPRDLGYADRAFKGLCDMGAPKCGATLIRMIRREKTAGGRLFEGCAAFFVRHPETTNRRELVSLLVNAKSVACLKEDAEYALVALGERSPVQRRALLDSFEARLHKGGGWYPERTFNALSSGHAPDTARKLQEVVRFDRAVESIDDLREIFLGQGLRLISDDLPLCGRIEKGATMRLVDALDELVNAFSNGFPTGNGRMIAFPTLEAGAVRLLARDQAIEYWKNVLIEKR